MATASWVTRREVVAAIHPAFTLDGATRDEILTVARAGRARSELVAVLEALPARRYRSLQEVWGDLPALPLG